MKKIELPKIPEDVSQSDNEFIATEILGWKKGRYISEWYKDGKDFYIVELNFYKDIQHSKMLDEWIKKTTLNIKIEFHKGFHNWHFHCFIINSVGKTLSNCINESEPFARTSCIVQAWVELNK